MRLYVSRCASRQLVVVAYGDGAADIASDARARARAAPFVRAIDMLPHRRVDAIVVAGPHVAHAATLSIMCPTTPMPRAF